MLARRQIVMGAAATVGSGHDPPARGRAI